MSDDVLSGDYLYAFADDCRAEHISRRVCWANRTELYYCDSDGDGRGGGRFGYDVAGGLGEEVY